MIVIIANPLIELPYLPLRLNNSFPKIMAVIPTPKRIRINGLPTNKLLTISIIGCILIDWMLCIVDNNINKMK